MTVIAVAGAGMLGYSFGSGASKRYFDDDQTMAGALLGSSADVTGVTSVYGALTDRDIGTGEHLDLTPAQRHEMLTEGGIQLAGTALAVGQAGRSFFGNRSGAAGAKANNGAPQANGSKATPPAEAVPPAKSAGSSNAGKAGTAEAAECATPPGCFAAGVPVLCEDGEVLIEAVQAGMRVWARDENDPLSALQLRLVEEVFVRHSLIWELELDNGVVIQSTAEHPFWVVGRGWVDVHEISPGDRFVGRDCREISVVDIRDTGRLEQVYNFRVAESHTYFVGGLAWGCDVWTHNTCVYVSESAGVVDYVGITDNIVARSAAHLRTKGITTKPVAGMGSLSRSEARAVEQVLIEHFGLGKTGGSLLNKINSISSTNPIYSTAKTTGSGILHKLGLFGF